MFAEFDEYLQSIAIDKSKHTISAYKNALTQFFIEKNINSLDDLKLITTRDIRQYRDSLVQKGLQKTTANWYQCYIGIFFNWLMINEYVTSNPVKGLPYLKKSKKVNRNFLTPEESKALISSCKKILDRFMMMMFLGLGLRESELINLKISDINGNDVLVHGKGDKERTIFMANSILNTYQEYLIWRKKMLEKKGIESDYIFISKRGTPFNPSSIYEKVKTLCLKAGISPERVSTITPHSLRHTFAVDMVDNSVPVPVIQEALGHSDIQTTMIYAEVRRKTLKEAMMRKEI